MRIVGKIATVITLGVGLFFEAGIPPAWGATITVNTVGADLIGNDGLCSLNEAITAANGNAVSGAAPGECAAGEAATADTVNFSPAVRGSINLGGELPVIRQSLNIAGPGATNLTINGLDNVRIFVIETPTEREVVGISGLTLTRAGGGLGMGAIAVSRGNTLNLSSSILTNNRATGGGGAILLFKANANITDCLFSNNRSDRGAAGAIFVDGGTLNLSRTTFSGNFAQLAAGAVHVQRREETPGIMNAINVTFSGNTTEGSGGALLVGGPEQRVSLTNVTIAGNRADSDGDGAGLGGGLFRNEATVQIKNSLIAGNTGGSAPDCYGSLTSQGHNLIQNVPGCDVTGDLTGNLPAGTPPNLGPLSDNGGPAPTHALLSGSPAIDAGVECPPTDQRGVPRSLGTACDIGAFEWGPPLSMVPTPVAFGDVRTGTAVDRSVTLVNTGIGPSGINGFAINPESARGSYTFTHGDCPSGRVLEVGQECRGSLRFAPATASSFPATLTAFYATGGARNLASEFPITGTGVVEPARTTPTPTPTPTPIPTTPPPDVTQPTSTEITPSSPPPSPSPPPPGPAPEPEASAVESKGCACRLDRGPADRFPFGLFAIAFAMFIPIIFLKFTELHKNKIRRFSSVLTNFITYAYVSRKSRSINQKETV